MDVRVVYIAYDLDTHEPIAEASSLEELMDELHRRGLKERVWIMRHELP